MALIPFTGIYLIITEYVTVLICGLSPVSPSNTCVAQSAASVAVCLASSDSWLAVCGVFCRQCRSLLRVAAVPHWAKYFAIDDGHLMKMLDILSSFLGKVSNVFDSIALLSFALVRKTYLVESVFVIMWFYWVLISELNQKVLKRGILFNVHYATLLVSLRDLVPSILQYWNCLRKWRQIDEVFLNNYPLQLIIHVFHFIWT